MAYRGPADDEACGDEKGDAASAQQAWWRLFERLRCWLLQSMQWFVDAATIRKETPTALPFVFCVSDTSAAGVRRPQKERSFMYFHTHSVMLKRGRGLFSSSTYVLLSVLDFNFIISDEDLLLKQPAFFGACTPQCILISTNRLQLSAQTPPKIPDFIVKYHAVDVEDVESVLMSQGKMSTLPNAPAYLKGSPMASSQIDSANHSHLPTDVIRVDGTDAAGFQRRQWVAKYERVPAVGELSGGSYCTGVALSAEGVMLVEMEWRAVLAIARRSQLTLFALPKQKALLLAWSVLFLNGKQMDLCYQLSIDNSGALQSRPPGNVSMQGVPARLVAAGPQLFQLMMHAAPSYAEHALVKPLATLAMASHKSDASAAKVTTALMREEGADKSCKMQ